MKRYRDRPIARSVCLALLCSCLLGCSSRQVAEISEARWNYLNAVRVHFAGHELWRENATLLADLKTFGSGSSHGSGKTATGTMEFIFKSESAELQKEVVHTLIGIYDAMDVFAPPSTSVVSEGEGLLASPEGWLKLRSRWSTDNRVTSTVRVLVIDYEIEFRPQSAPTEKQDLRRLSWVRWSPPLDT